MAKATMMKRMGAGKPIFTHKGFTVRPIKQGKETFYGIFRGKKVADKTPNKDWAIKKCKDEAFLAEQIAAEARAKAEAKYQEILKQEKKEKAKEIKSKELKAKANTVTSYIKKRKNGKN